MYVVIETERHPDRFIGLVYGPYEDWDEAEAEAKRINDLWGHYHASIHELEAP
jgi:hypothetical protein